MSFSFKYLVVLCCYINSIASSVHLMNVLFSFFFISLSPFLPSSNRSDRIVSSYDYSCRSKLCLLYTPHQIALALVFLSLFCLGYQPSTPTANSYRTSGSAHHHHHQQHYHHQHHHQAGKSSSDTTWLEIFEKDIEEHVLRSKQRSYAMMLAHALSR